MSPSELSWLQGCLFLFLGVLGGVAGGYGLNRCQNRRTNSGTSDVELSSILVENDITTTPFEDAQSSGSDEEARSPSNLSNPVGETMAFTGSPSRPDRNRLRSKSLRRCPRRLLKTSAKTRKTSSHFLESLAQTATPNFARRETAYTAIVADRTPSPVSSPTAGLLRPSNSGREDEALSPSHPVGEALALSGTRSRPDRKRCRSNSRRRMNVPEKRTKTPFEKFTGKDEARNVDRPEPANMVVAYSFSTSMASTTAVLRRPPRRHFVPRPSREIPLVDDVQASTFDGFRPHTSTGVRSRPARRNQLPKYQLKVRLCCPKCEEKVIEEIREVPGVFDVRADRLFSKVVVVASIPGLDEHEVLRKARKINRKAKFVPLDDTEKPKKGDDDKKKQAEEAE